jgi:hypothetical protein
MKRHFWKLTIAMSLLASAAVGANAAERPKMCSEAKPFREVAQDETKTVAELCLEALESSMPSRSGRVLANGSQIGVDFKGRLGTRHASRN